MNCKNCIKQVYLIKTSYKFMDSFMDILDFFKIAIVLRTEVTITISLAMLFKILTKIIVAG